LLKHFQVIVEEFESPVLRGNPCGDPWVREVAVILPRSAAAGGPGGEGSDLRRFPVVLILAGYSSKGVMLLNRRAWLPSFPEQIDRLRDRGAIGDMILVLPDALTIYGGSQYLNSPATGRYRDMITEDLIPWIDRRFPSLAGPQHRAVAGKSSGGYGALTLAMERPDLFQAAACHSGDMYFEYCYRNDLPRLMTQLDRHGGLERFMEAFLSSPKKTSEAILAMNIVAMAAAYSPNAGKPWRVDLPVDPRTGEVDPAVWSRWLERDPIHLLERHADSLRKMSLLYLDCGSRDQFHLQYGLRIFRSRLDRLGIPYVAEEFDDDHTDTGYRYDVSLPRIWKAVRSRPPTVDG
jgi:enterochelin esterase family protein